MKIKAFKTYNLKLTREAYFKLNKIIEDTETKKNIKYSKGEIINKMILNFDKKTDDLQTDLVESIAEIKNE